MAKTTSKEPENVVPEAAIFERVFFALGKGNLIFCCNQENCFESVGRQNNYNSPTFQGQHI